MNHFVCEGCVEHCETDATPYPCPGLCIVTGFVGPADWRLDEGARGRLA